jgi:hypothetical protein
MSPQTIDEVILKLDAIIEASIKNKSRLGYFATLYKRMTVAVKNGIENGAFEDGVRMEKLDIIFANRYLDAYDAYQNRMPLTQCWKTTFDAAENNSIIVLQHLILGITSHINLDLGVAAAETMKGQSIALLKNDFDKINTVIASLVDQVQSELGVISFPMRFFDKVMNTKDEAVINFSIGVARKEAWLLATSLAALPQPEQGVLISKTDAIIAQLETKIISPDAWSKFLILLAKWMEWNDTVKIIRLMNKA